MKLEGNDTNKYGTNSLKGAYLSQPLSTQMNVAILAVAIQSGHSWNVIGSQNTDKYMFALMRACCISKLTHVTITHFIWERCGLLG